MICPSCRHESRRDARYCEGCGVELPAPCTKCGVPLSVGARFCGACGHAAAEPAVQVEAARKVITVIFGDLVGSTALHESLDAESTRRVMARFYDVMRGAVARHGGHLEKFVGDGVVALFGVPQVGEDDALRAVRCAAAMVADLSILGEELQRDWGVRLSMRAGVNTGELVIDGTGERVGDAMNTAARLEQAAAAGEVLIGESTWRLVRHDVQLDAVEPLALKGKAAPVRAWRLLATVPGPEETLSGRVEAPLVGRVAELDRLRRALDDAMADRCCRLVTVIGSPGMGKTRLAEEFSGAVGTVAAVVPGRCEPSGEGITFLPVAEMLRAVAGIGETDAPDVVRAKLATLIEGEAEADRIVARVASLLGAAEPASVQETFWGVRRVLEAVARRRPLVVVLDDVHWGQPLFLDLVEHLVEWVQDAPLLLLALARPELRETREVLTVPGRRATDVIDLAPLAARDSRAFVDGMLGQADLPPDLLDRILATTEGNPLFLGETLRMLVDEGSITRSGQAWVTAGSGAVEVPPTIQQLLSARIERLQHEERAVVERAAVIGKQFYRGAVAELVTPPVRSGLDTHLATLRRKEMVEPDGTYWVDEPVYRFHHVLIRDAAYGLLLKEARSELHEKFADWLAAKAGELVGEHEEVIAYHLEQAHEYRRQLGSLDEHGRALGQRAAELLASAGRRALARADLAAATNLLRRACERTEADDAQLLWDLTEALLSAGDTTSARDVVPRLAALAGHDRRLRAQVEVLTGQISLLTGTSDPEANIEHLADATDELVRLGDGPGAAKAHHVTAQALAQLGRLGAAEAALDQALVAARRVGDGRRITAVLAAAPRAALWGPSPVVRASGRCLDVLRILRMTPGNRHVEAIALRCQATLEAMRGRFGPARDILAGARATLQELGLGLELHELATHAGMVELLAGDAVAAEAHLGPARDGYAALGVKVRAAQAAALLGRALLEQGREQDALEQTLVAEERAGGDLKTTITWCGVRAEVLARRGEADEALALAERAVALAEPTDALPDKADAAMALARVLRAIGRPDDARATAWRAHELYRSKDHAVGIARATEFTGRPVPVEPRPTPTPAATERPAVLGDRPPERVFAEICRRWAERDLDGIADLYAGDVVRVDRRIVGWGQAHGRAAMRENIQSLLRMSPDIRLEPDEVLARDDRVLAVRGTAHGSGGDGTGEFELAAGFVIVTSDGRVQRMEQFEYDDIPGMLARYTELGGAPPGRTARPAEQVMAEYHRRVEAGDVEGALQSYAADFVAVDHRVLGWGEQTKGDMPWMHESVFGAISNLRFRIDEVLACDDRVIAFVLTAGGTSLDGGGPFEIAFGVVEVIEDGRRIQEDLYEPQDRRAMLIRFAELGGGQGLLGGRVPERAVAEWTRRLPHCDVDRMLDLYPDECVQADHRVLGWEELGKEEGLRPLYESFYAAGSDWWASIDEVLACDDRVIAFLDTFHGVSNDGGGPFEIALGIVNVVEDGRFSRIEVFEPEDRQAMLARYAELSGQSAERTARPPERVMTHYARCFSAQDLDGVLATYTPDSLTIDHRLAGWGETDYDGLRLMHQSAFQLTADQRFEIDEVLACDDRVIALTAAVRGTAPDGGGAFEVGFGIVAVVEDGRRSRQEIYEPEDRQRLLVRFAELGGGQGPLGDRPPERWAAEYCRRFAARDVDGLVALYAPDHVLTDHRALGWDELRGDDMRTFFESMFGAGSGWWFRIDEILACDDQVLAITFTVCTTSKVGGGAAEIAIGAVAVVRNGVLVQEDQYEHDDRQAMLARYAELSGSASEGVVLAPLRVMTEHARHVSERDLDGVMKGYAPHFVSVDHRLVGWGELDYAGIRSLHESGFQSVSNIRWDVDEVLACDDRTIALTTIVRGTSTEGGGAGEIAFGVVATIENGQRTRQDMYEPGDRQAMLVRFAELGGGQSVLGDRPPERVIAEFARRWPRCDVDLLSELFTDDFELIDHRRLSWAPILKDGMRSYWETAYTSGSNWWVEIVEVLACDEGIGAFRFLFRGTTNDGGGPFELAYGALAQITGDRISRIERFEDDDRHAMLVRYAELSGADPQRSARLPERVISQYCRLATARDTAGWLSVFAPDFVSIDHRAVGWGQIGRDGLLPLHESLYDVTADARIEIDEVLACDDQTIALLISVRGSHLDGGGSFELSLGLVSLFVDGLRARDEVYEPEDRRAMLIRFAELGGGQGPLGDRPPERAWAEWVRRFPHCDADRLLDLYSDEFVQIDHRVLGWEGLGKEDGLRPLYESFFAAGSDWWTSIDEVLACDDRVIAFLGTLHGVSNDGGGPFELAYGVVAVAGDGGVTRTERFEYDDRQAMLVRFAELGGGLGPLGNRPPERWVASFASRWARGDVDRLLELFTDEYVGIDHRALGWEEERKDGLATRWQSFLAAGFDYWFEVSEVLACDDRVGAFRCSFHGRNHDGGGQFEIAYGTVGEIRDGLAYRIERFEYDDRQAMLARFAELGGRGPDRPSPLPERVFADYVRAVAERDFEAMLATYAADSVSVDHRSVGWGEVRHDDLRGLFESFLASAPDARWEIDEVLACDDRVIALRAAIRGTNNDGGGQFEIGWGLVALIENGGRFREDIYEPEDRQAMLVRFAELGGGLGQLGDRPSERAVADWGRRLARRDVDGLLDLYADGDFVHLDHRTLGWEDVGNKDGLRRVYESFLAVGSDFWFSVDEVLACDDRVIAFLCSVHGTNNEGGGRFEIAFGRVAVVEAGLYRSIEVYGTDDRQAMLARYAELGGQGLT